MRRKIFLLFLICAALLWGQVLPALAGAGVAGSGGVHVLPLEITRITLGENASFDFVNRGGIGIDTVSFRTRGYSEDGKIIFYFSGDSAKGGRVYLDLTLFGAPLNFLISPGDAVTTSVSDGYQAVFSSVLEVAVQQYTTQDGKTYRIPESQLCWFSSRDGYADPAPHTFQYDYPDADLFQKAYTFSLGLRVDRIYPELTDMYQVSKPGYLVRSVQDLSLLADTDLAEGDLIWAINGTPIVDDPCALEKGKAGMTEGKDLILSVLRDDRPLEIRVAASALR